MSLRTAQQPPGAPSAQRSTPCRTTDAPWKGVGPDEAAGAHIRLPGAPIARVLMGRGLMPVQPRRRPDNSCGGGDPPSISAGRRGPGPRPLRHPSARPRPPRGRGRWVRRRLRRRRKEDGPRPRRGWSWGSREAEGGFVFSSSFLVCVLVRLLFFCLVVMGGRRSGSPARTLTRLGTGFVFLKAGKWAAVREGSGKPLPWP